MQTFTLFFICISLSLNLCLGARSSRAQSSNSNMNDQLGYDIVLSRKTLKNIIAYKNALAKESVIPGSYLLRALQAIPGFKGVRSLRQMPNDKFIDLLLSTKKPLIFAESSVKSDGEDWSDTELQLLGDLNIAMRVKIYDNGEWDTSKPRFRRHILPLEGTLLFMPGPLLEQGRMSHMTPDLQEISDGTGINQFKYNRMIERRLAPLLYYANEDAGINGKKALVAIPGLGCGVFSGIYNGEMGEHLNKALRYILEKHAINFSNIVYVHFDPHSECSDAEYVFQNVKYRVRRSKVPQLSNPTRFEERRDDFSDCLLYKVVAWDHVSFPGNDFFAGNRHTDDGVSAAATNSMKVITGVRGTYDGMVYKPPSGKTNWLQVVNQKGVKLRAKNNVKVLVNGFLLDLMDDEVIAYCNAPNVD